MKLYLWSQTMMKKNSVKYTVLSAAILLSLPVCAAEIETNAAVMQAMDKVTGRVNKVTIPVKSKLAFGDFSLVLRACKKRPAEETPENFAFIDVTDKSFGTEEYNIFRGWVLSSTPGISAIEHPIYDVWLLECVDIKDIDETKLLSDNELTARDALPSRDILQDKAKSEPVTEIVEAPEDEPKVIHIKEFIQEDKDIEKNIKNTPTYISENPTGYISDIEEGEEPENLLLFTKMQEVDNKAEIKTNTATEQEDDLSKAIDAEINSLRQ